MRDTMLAFLSLHHLVLTPICRLSCGHRLELSWQLTMRSGDGDSPCLLLWSLQARQDQVACLCSIHQVQVLQTSMLCASQASPEQHVYVSHSLRSAASAGLKEGQLTLSI